jgi:hypothetical protein
MIERITIEIIIIEQEIKVHQVHQVHQVPPVQRVGKVYPELMEPME